MSDLSRRVFDTLVLGSGISGLNLARKLAQAGQKVFLCSKEAVTEGSSNYAQGGVAVVSPLNPEDNIDSHIQDTIDSGKGLCNEHVVRAILELGWSKVLELSKLGVQFDLKFNIEGSHSYNRIMHVGDATGRAILKPLLDKVSRNYNISIAQGHELVSLLKSGNRVVGAALLNITGDLIEVFANNIVLATGGLGGLYQETTNPSILTGDGIVLAYDAGAKVENLEFVQFHPTVFRAKDSSYFLISEALRGAAAQLRNINGELFAYKYHPEAELATRDVVSRGIFTEMQLTKADSVYIDARKLSSEFLAKEFPNIYQYCLEQGYDLSTDLLPVRPAAHYTIGGIKTDLPGRTNIPGLFALGECASNGLHGANRLASNSLLECIVVPELLAELILAETEQNIDFADYYYASDYPLAFTYEQKQEQKKNINSIREIMTSALGVERKLKAIQFAIKYLEALDESKERNMALLVAKSILARKESRGVHYRVDTPQTNPAYARPTILAKENRNIISI
jgi:L-aspartate oxidase